MIKKFEEFVAENKINEGKVIDLSEYEIDNSAETIKAMGLQDLFIELWAAEENRDEWEGGPVIVFSEFMKDLIKELTSGHMNYQRLEKRMKDSKIDYSLAVKKYEENDAVLYMEAHGEGGHIKELFRRLPKLNLKF